jgi:hypothetical protein
VFPEIFFASIDIGSLIEDQVIAGIQQYQFEMDRRDLVRGVAAGESATDIILAQRKRRA